MNILNSFLRSKKTTFSSKKLLEKNFKSDSDFTFIQVGANDGVSFDFLYDFVIKRKSEGIVIEPIRSYYDELVVNYSDFPNIIKVNKAIHPSEKSIVINKISPEAVDEYPNWVKGVASLNENHHLKLGIQKQHMQKEVVAADNLMAIINTNYNRKTLNYLQVDTEGYDYEVLKMLNFSVLKPDIIKYETSHISKENNEKLKTLLEKNGYFIIPEIEDNICIQLDIILL
jgi:FkbM family methyltransferase